MAKCSREQRDRAVDLYVRYERYAADVIRELGYPSRGMLPASPPGAANATGATRTSRSGPRWTITSDTAGV